MNKFLKKNMKYVGSLAMFAAIMSSNSTSLWFNHQPKVPAKLKNNNK
ncbi:MAG: cyclic lactone autoinducer peptide [Romboutsia sp.]